MMKIEAIDVIPLRGKSGDGPLTAQGILVRIRVASGMVGLGETATDDAHIATSHATVSKWLDFYRPHVLGTDCGNVNVLHQRLDAAELQDRSGCPAARAAIEMAVYDLIGKARGCPLHEVLGGGFRDAFELFREIGFGDRDPSGTAIAAIRQCYAGIRLAIAPPQGSTGPDAAERRLGVAHIRAVLEAVGHAPFVDIVAHQSLGNEAKGSMLVEALLAQEFHLNLALVQPLHRLDFKGHGRLRQKLPIPIVLDESITSPEAMAQVVRHAAADRIVLDIWRVGGLRNAKRIANICESAAIGVTVSGACRTAIGRAALGHIAASIDGDYPVSFGSAQSADDDVVAGCLTIVGGRAALGTGQGLGVTLDEAWAATAMRSEGIAA